MKILKRPDNIIFDTENPDKMKFTRQVHPCPTPLFQKTTKTEHDFLSDHFRPHQSKEHPIFKDFGSSYYYFIAD